MQRIQPKPDVSTKYDDHCYNRLNDHMSTRRENNQSHKHNYNSTKKHLYPQGTGMSTSSSIPISLPVQKQRTVRLKFTMKDFLKMASRQNAITSDKHKNLNQQSSINQLINVYHQHIQTCAQNINMYTPSEQNILFGEALPPSSSISQQCTPKHRPIQKQQQTLPITGPNASASCNIKQKPLQPIPLIKDTLYCTTIDRKSGISVQTKTQQSNIFPPIGVIISDMIYQSAKRDEIPKQSISEPKI